MLWFLLFLLALIVSLAFVGVYAWRERLNPHDDHTGYFVPVVVFGIVAVVMFGLLVGYTTDAYTKIVNAQARHDRLSLTIQTQRQRSDAISNRIESLLTEQYPQYEASTIIAMVEKTPGLLAVRFPELQASKTFLSYTNQITVLQDKIFDTKIARQQAQQTINALRNNGALYLTAVLP